MRSPTEGSAPGRRRLALACIATLLVGILLGHSLSSPSSGGDRAATPAKAGAARSLAGVPVSFPDSPRGAAQAVAAYQRAFATPAVLRPGVLQARIEAVATPDYAATMLAANSPGGERLAAGPIGAGVRRRVQTLYSAIPIGYRVESFEPDRARVLTWGFTLLGNAEAVEPAAYFGLTHTELVWMEGRWRIAETRGGFGPTPKLATKPGPLGAYDVIDLARGLESYELAP
ncbi:MAG TPA: hypothetical protein VHU14_00930 [Solirubrobacterales bacterium]|jgi:hypothetical protein|nr:hypothetical protein [Solirubrobacterales bacterium]